MAAGSGTSRVRAGATSDKARILAAIAKYGPSVQALAEKRYGISGEALLAKLAEGESRALSDPEGAAHAVSSAGAKKWTQFTAGSRAEAIRKYGIDPWADPDQAFHAASLHLRGKINGSTGLEGYNPGDPNYPHYILGQHVGDVHGVSRAAAPAAGASSAPTAGAPGSALTAAFDAGQQSRLSDALAGAAAPAPVVSGSLPALPDFAAGPSLPQGYQAPPSGGGPQPVQRETPAPALSDLSLPAGTGQPTATAPASDAVGAAAARDGYSASYPTARRGKIIGTPHAGTHTLGNWQSDNAVDIGLKVGTPMVAMDGGVVVRVRRHPQGSGRFAGDQITIRGANGNSYFYAHGKASVEAGDRVKAGEEIGTTGSANGVAHLHFAVEHGDPRKVIGQRR